MIESLLQTKITLPPALPGQVSRTRLLRRLDECLERKLALISAPAGYGKTSLVKEWAAGQVQERRVGWLSLEEADSDPVRFFRYLAVSMGRAAPGRGEGLLRLDFAPHLSRLKKPVGEAQLNVLVNELAQLGEELVLILEDYHLIDSEAVHSMTGYLLDHLPANVHWVITTRSDPPLPLSRLRGRGELVELRAKDLRFTAAEARQFLNGPLQTGLEESKVEQLAARMEGWAAGLQMAGLVLANRPDAGSAIDEITGSTRYIMDYLVEEVLQQQPEEVQRFLLYTSILNRMCAGLCDEVLAGTLAANGDAGSAKMLEAVERTNLFIDPMDERREWYRYHHLFGDLLRKRLRQDDAQLAAGLHQRASTWFARHGMAGEAIQHSLAGEDFRRAAELIEEAAEALLKQSEQTLLLSWLERLPEGRVQERPLLCIYHALALLLSSTDAEAVEKRLIQAEEGVREGVYTGEAAVVRGLVEMLKGDIPKSLQLSRLALQNLKEERLLFNSLAADNLGMCSVLMGDLTTASQAFEQVVRTAKRSGNTMMEVAALSNLAGLQVVQGHLRKARASYEKIVELASDGKGRRLPAAGKALFGLGELAREMNNLEEASRCFEESISLLDRTVEIGAVIAYLSLARVRQAQGAWGEAERLIENARERAAASHSVQMDDRLVEAAQARHWLLQGELEPVRAWAEARGLESMGAVELRSRAKSAGFDLLEPEVMLAARLHLAEGSPDKAIELLEALAEIDEEKGRVRRRLEVLSLLAAAWEVKGETEKGLSVLRGALEAGKREGFGMTFTGEGKSMKRLLTLAVQRGIEAEYAGRLLRVMVEGEAFKETTARAAKEVLIEPLSERELEVLGLIGEGLANAEIAQRLVISLSTVKGHTTNIYSKLGVNSRSQAAARGRALGLLS
jgi:LuxR family transcriptional regulator, maltose regulon positive regulatory protein